MKPLDQVIRDRMRPVLTSAGFKRTTGRVFTFENQEANRAYVNVRSHPMGRSDTSFFVDIFIEPAIWRDWWLMRAPNRTDHIGGVWTARLSPGTLGGLWQINLDDEEGGASLTQALTAALPDVVDLTDSRTLASRKRESPYRPLTAGHPEMPLAMLGPSPELDQRLAELETGSVFPTEFDTAAYMAFLRGWISDHFPS